MSFRSALATLLLCGIAVQAQPYATWSKYRTVTINTTATNGGANVTQAVTNFPVLVKLSGQNDAAGANVLNEALAGGADIRFTDSTGMTALPYQIDSWDNGSAAVWVLIPTVAASAQTKIRLYWGKPGETNASSGAGVFNSTSGFTGVWHLNEGTGAGTILDATANGLNGTRHSEVQSVPGIVGSARFYNAAMTGPTPPTGTESYHVDSLEDNALYRAAGSNTRITISAWVNVRAPGTDVSQGIFGQYRYSGSTGRSSYALMHRSSGSFSLLNTTNGTGDGRRAYTNTDFPQEQWRHVVATIGTSADGNVVMYVDGVAQEITGNSTQATFAVPTTTVSRPLIGALERAFNQHFIGYIDELRFSNGTIRNADWVKLEYETQKPGASAVSLGATASNVSRVLFYPTKVAAYTVNTPVTANVPTVTGTPAAGTPFSITPSTLPAGLSFSTANGTISGTPTAVAASQQYIVTVNLSGGGTGADTLQIGVQAGTPPGAPEAVTAVVSSGQAVVTWQAPVLSGSAPINGYLVRAVQDTTKSCSWTTGALSCTVTGLANGTSYTFVVRAVSTAGNGPFSAPSVPVLPAGISSAPTNVVVSQIGTSTAVQVTWNVPTNNGGSPIVEYYATGSPGGTCYAPAGAGTTATCTATGLAIGGTYTFTVYAVNAAGNSPTSTPSNSLTLSSTSLLPGQYSLSATGTGRSFRFALTPDAMASTEALTMTVSNLQGRTVWSQTVQPRRDRLQELVWNEQTGDGRAVSPGIYLVRVTAQSGSGQTADFIRPGVLQR